MLADNGPKCMRDFWHIEARGGARSQAERSASVSGGLALPLAHTKRIDMLARGELCHHGALDVDASCKKFKMPFMLRAISAFSEK